MGDRVFITAHTDAEVSTFYDSDYMSRDKDLGILALPLSEGRPPVKANISGTLHLTAPGIVVALSLSSGACDAAFAFL